MGSLELLEVTTLEETRTFLMEDMEEKGLRINSLYPASLES